MSLLLPSYPAKRGYYTIMELKFVAIVLGYDGDLFQRCLARHGIDINAKHRYSELEVKTWLDDHIFDLELDRVFNHYTAHYSVRVIKKVLLHLHQRSLTYNEVATSRRVFQAVTAKERRLTLPTDKNQILFALKMTNKILPPTKLHHLLQAMGHYRLESPSSLKLFDFFDIVSRAQDLESLTSEYLQSKANSDAHLDVTFETLYSRLLASLDEKYKASLIKHKTKKARSDTSRAEFVPEPQKTTFPKYYNSIAIQRATESREAMRPTIKETTQQVYLARAGNLSLSSSQGERTLNRLVTSYSNKRPHTVPF
uniref:Uncharacterized protein n=1 Tax=Amphimedon queenslandica TaxID=400682 RepID=A0A1X7UZU1_AMPQE